MDVPVKRDRQVRFIARRHHTLLFIVCDRRDRPALLCDRYIIPVSHAIRTPSTFPTIQIC